MTIFLPDGNTNEKERLLSCLMEWTTEPKLIYAMVKRGRADFPGIAILAGMVKATLDAEDAKTQIVTPGEVVQPQQTDVQPLDERRVAACILAFLVDGETRNVLARYVSQAHGMAYDQAKSELYELRVHLATTYKVAPQEIPSLCAGNPELTEQVRKQVALEHLLAGPMMVAGSEEFVASYEADAEELDAESIEWLKGLNPRLQELATRFPPMCLVKSAGKRLMCPAPGRMVFVRGYDLEDEQAVCLVSPYEDEDAPIIPALPEDLILVAYRGKVTGEAVYEASKNPTAPLIS